MIWKRFLGAVVGVVYAVLYGFWTLLETGGGHGNLIWVVLFCTSYFYGTFFPIAGLIAADLKPRWARLSLGVLIAIHLVATTVVLIAAFRTDLVTADLQKMWEFYRGSLVLSASIHLLPIVVLASILLTTILAHRKNQKYL